MIDETRYAFGLDTERYSSKPSANKWMDWEAVALHKDPTVTFVVARAGISWGYQDALFSYNWRGIREIDDHRLANGIESLPVGRGAYHVLYPSQNPIRQYDNFMRIVGSVADWEHDRPVIDLELNQDQSRRTITDCAKKFAYACHNATGHYPMLYGRTLWLNRYTYPQELSFMDLWGAQYCWPYPWPLYTPEHEPPLEPLPVGFATWLAKQTADRGKPIGSPVKKVMDYNRWNGGPDVVAKYFGYDGINVPTTPLPPLETPPDALDRLWAHHEELH